MFTVVSLHDVAPATFEESATLLSWAEQRGLTTSLLVVAGPWKGTRLRPGSDFGSWLREAERRGHEIVVHGWDHTAVPTTTARAHRRVRARAIGRGAAEFAHLTRAESRRRAGGGLRSLRAIGCAPRGFVPPAWLVSEEAVWGLRDVGFDYTTTRTRVVDLRSSELMHIPAYCQRPESLLTAPGCATVDALVRRRIRRRMPVRIAAHPADVRTDRLCRATQLLFDHAADTPVFTYGELLSRTRHTGAPEMIDDTPTGVPRSNT